LLKLKGGELEAVESEDIVAPGCKASILGYVYKRLHKLP
jgi:hypothetical protein